MRAQNQQDLIYKRGQAGITKASVTIVFDNSDRENSPPGMENYAQITVTRQVRASASYDDHCFYHSFSVSRAHPHPVCCDNPPLPNTNTHIFLDRSTKYL